MELNTSEVVAILGENASLRAELAALKDAVRPVVKDWKEERSVAVDIDAGKEVGYVVATFEQLDALAALVGEE